MSNKEPYKNLRHLLVIFIILASFATIMPSSSKSNQMNRACLDREDVSGDLQKEENNRNQLDCTPYSETAIINLYILGLVNIDELTMWVLGVDRRLIVLKMMHEKRMIQASDIAQTTDRSLQNISYAMRELEEHGLIQCLTPGKHTWKKFILTEKGTEVFEKLKTNHLLDK